MMTARKLLSAALTILLLAACLPQDGARTGAILPPPEADRDVFLTLVASISRGGKPQAALAYLDDYLMRYPDDRRALLLKADSLAMTGDLEIAKTVYTGLAAEARMPEALAGLGRVAARQGRWDAAATWFADAHRHIPSDPALLNDYGYALLRTGQARPAFDLLARAHDLMPEDARIRTNFLIAARATGRGPDVERILAPMPEAERQRIRLFIRNWEPAS